MLWQVCGTNALLLFRRGSAYRANVSTGHSQISSSHAQRQVLLSNSPVKSTRVLESPDHLSSSKGASALKTSVLVAKNASSRPVSLQSHCKMPAASATSRRMYWDGRNRGKNNHP